MFNFLFRLFLTFNATSLIIVVYLIGNQIDFGKFSASLSFIPSYISYLVYISITIFLTYLSILISDYLDNDSIELSENEPSPIVEIEQANNAYLPSYLGYFFVALSISECDTLIFVFAILFVFTFLSQTLYFNPLFLIFKFHFYYIKTTTNIKIFLITKKILKDPSKLSFSKLKRINDFTFIDRE